MFGNFTSIGESIGVKEGAMFSRIAQGKCVYLTKC